MGRGNCVDRKVDGGICHLPAVGSDVARGYGVDGHVVEPGSRLLPEDEVGRAFYVRVDV